ncbi:MAG: GNAT family N-acetyltransferase [Rubrivivax sp.]
MQLADLQPGWRSDFLLHRHGALVAERDDCIVVRTPENPTYYWGNFLLLPQAPGDADLAHWLRRFDDEVAALQPASQHVALGINTPPSALPQLPAWEAAGFEVIATTVLELQPGGLRATSAAPRGRVELLQLDLQQDVEAIVTLECADTHGFAVDSYAEYRRRQLRRYAAMAAQGHAAWFGVRCDGVLAADCGLMQDGAGLGRFQRVATHPAWRRRGLCTALVHGVSAWGLAHWGLQRILMCADPDDVAIAIYESLGYRRIARECCLQRNAPQDRAA